jgi:hypothetical protein
MTAENFLVHYLALKGPSAQLCLLTVPTGLDEAPIPTVVPVPFHNRMLHTHGEPTQEHN